MDTSGDSSSRRRHWFEPVTFNAAFYSTAATVIPVLFLALTIQGDFVTKTLMAADAWRRKGQAATLAPANHGWRRLVTGLPEFFLERIVGVVGGVILLDGVVGAIKALLALERQWASHSDQKWVIQAT